MHRWAQKQIDTHCGDSLDGISARVYMDTVLEPVSYTHLLDKAATEHGNTVVVLDHHLADGRAPKHAAVICDPHMD